MGELDKSFTLRSCLSETLHGFVSVFDLFGIFSRTRMLELQDYPYLDAKDAFNYDLAMISRDLKEAIDQRGASNDKRETTR